MQIIFTSSSVLDIFRGESDLSRRAISYLLPELSFREFIVLESYTINEIINKHKDIAQQINKNIKPLFEFTKYLKYGQYPYFIEGVDDYYNKLLSIINLIIEVDIHTIENWDFNIVVKLKKLLYAIASSAPFTPNISKLSERLGISRPFLIKALNLLEKRF